MPGLNGTGPTGQGLFTGRGRGIRRGSTRRGVGGVSNCTCPKCGYTVTHTRGIPCTNQKCPECGTPLQGDFCLPSKTK